MAKAAGAAPVHVPLKPVKQSGARNGLPTDTNSLEKTQQSEHLKNPQNEGDDNHNVQDLLDLAVHRNVVVHEPQ
jgi:hypothetical protein